MLALLCLSAALADEPATSAAASAAAPASDVHAFHHSELTVVRQVAPTYPDAALTGAAGDVDCKAQVTIDEKGVPFAIEFPACPDAFQPTTKDALLQWRWQPALWDGKPTKARTLLTVKYRLTGDGAAPPATSSGPTSAGTTSSATSASSGTSSADVPDVVPDDEKALPTVDIADVKVKSRVQPFFPQDEKEHGSVDVSCVVHVFLGTDGKPFDLRFESCPTGFRQSTRDALSQWVWYPVKVDGKPTKAQTTMTVKYHLE